MLHAVFGKNGNRIWFGSQAWLGFLGEMYQADLVSWATVKGAILGVASCASTMSKAPHKRLALQLSKLGMCWTTQKTSSAKHKLGSRLGDSSSSHAWLFHASPRNCQWLKSRERHHGECSEYWDGHPENLEPNPDNLHWGLHGVKACETSVSLIPGTTVDVLKWSPKLGCAMVFGVKNRQVIIKPAKLSLELVTILPWGKTPLWCTKDLDEGCGWQGNLLVSWRNPIWWTPRLSQWEQSPTPILRWTSSADQQIWPPWKCPLSL